MSDTPTSDVLNRTRQSLHQVAEHVLAAARMRTVGDFTLLPGGGGFRTPPLADGRVIAVDGIDLVVLDSSERAHARAPLTTVRAAAALVGVEPGFPSSGPPATPFEPDAPLLIDPVAAGVLADWFALGAEALRRLSAALEDDGPSEALLFPEHFDIGITAAGVNYGASPGDADLPMPYVYVGPHACPPAHDDFWNARFGAYRSHEDIRSADDALAFFLAGRERLRAV